uniref:DUF5727 domain-containing protein n=1 Tax=Schistocephalus solidus TaxID=70667 RepID=A0A0X3P480_SCHSO
MSLIGLVFSVALVVLSGDGYTGKFQVADNGRVWFKTWFKPVRVSSLRHYECSNGKCEAGTSHTTYSIEEDKEHGVYNVYYNGDPNKVLNWITIHGEREEQVVISFRSTYKKPILSYSFSPGEVANLTHFPITRSEIVLIECPIYSQRGFEKANVRLYDNGREKCNYGISKNSTCATRRGSARGILVIQYSVNFEDAPASIARHITCTSDVLDYTYFMSHFVQFPDE